MLPHYDYPLPERLIAKSPASPRDSARLFVYNSKTNEISFDTFRHLGKYLPQKSLLVFNDTKVVPARLWLKRATGGKIQVLLMMNEFQVGDTLVKGIVDRKLSVGARLFFAHGEFLEVVRQDEQFFFFKPSMPTEELWKLLAKEGVTPIPPYIKGSTMEESTLREKYQSMFAKHPASVAAPTASLHFTPRLMNDIHARGVRDTRVTLHVGAGTFAPINESNFASKKLFTEYYDITGVSAKKIALAKERSTPVVTVGTTALRTLESAAIKKNDYFEVSAGASKTEIFIFPPYRFKIADALITNFHVPKSSLLLLVDAFLKHNHAQRDVLALYDIAVKENFRFYSFGDGMLII